MKSKIVVFALASTLFVPSEAFGQNDDDQVPEIWRSPSYNNSVYINYDESTGTAVVNFSTAIDNVEILLYKDGNNIAAEDFDATSGMQIPIYLSAYGSGEFCIEVRNGSTLLAIYYVTL